MIIGTLVKFLICYSMPAVLNVIEISIGEKEFLNEEYVGYLIDISNFLVILHSASNPFVHYAGSAAFRRILLRSPSVSRRLSRSNSAMIPLHKKKSTQHNFYNQNGHLHENHRPYLELPSDINYIVGSEISNKIKNGDAPIEV